MACAASSTRSTSSTVMPCSRREMPTTPRLLREETCVPLSPTYARSILYPDVRSAFSTEAAMDAVASATSTTTPLRTPREGATPTPITQTFPSPSTSPTKVHTLLVPTSMPTIVRPTVSLALPFVPAIRLPRTSQCFPKHSAAAEERRRQPITSRSPANNRAHQQSAHPRSEVSSSALLDQQPTFPIPATACPSPVPAPRSRANFAHQ